VGPIPWRRLAMNRLRNSAATVPPREVLAEE
jgi:hypothetical protein